MSMERLLRLTAGRVIDLNTLDSPCRLDDGVDTGHVQPRNRLHLILESVKPPIVVCIGISAYKLVQGLSLAGKPTVIFAQHTIT